MGAPTHLFRVPCEPPGLGGGSLAPRTSWPRAHLASTDAEQTRGEGQRPRDLACEGTPVRADGRDATSRHSPVGGQAQSRVAQACARTRTRTHTGAGGPSGSGLRKQACAGAPGLAGTRFQATRDGSVDAAQERRRDVLRESSGPGGPCRQGAGGQLTRNSAFRSFLADRLGRGTDGDGHVPAASRLRRSLGLRLAGVHSRQGVGGFRL